MGRRRFASVLSLAVVGSLVLGACGDDDEDSADTGDTAPRTRRRTTTRHLAGGTGRHSDTGGDTGGDKPTIVLVQNAWTASALNVEIAKQLIETNLGNTVELTSIDENTMFAGLSSGELDAALELWPSGLSEDEQKYFDDGTVVEIGELGAIGRIGWYVPDYVLEEYPELATWEGFKDPEVAKAFAIRRDRRQRTVPRHRPVVLAVRRDDHRQPRAAVPGDLLRVGGSDGRRARQQGCGAGADPHVLVGADGGRRQVQPAEGRAAPVHRRVLRRSGRDRLRLPRGRAREDRLGGARREGSGGVRVLAELHDHHRGPARRCCRPPRSTACPAAEVAAEWIAANEAVWSTWL